MGEVKPHARSGNDAEGHRHSPRLGGDHRLERKRDMDREEIFEKLVQMLKNQGARKIAVFGSYARSTEKPGSDIDVIVEFSGRKSLLELVRMQRELSEALGIKVDLLTEKSISPYLINTIRREMRLIYG